MLFCTMMTQARLKTVFQPGYVVKVHPGPDMFNQFLLNHLKKTMKIITLISFTQVRGKNGIKSGKSHGILLDCQI